MFRSSWNESSSVTLFIFVESYRGPTEPKAQTKLLATAAKCFRWLWCERTGQKTPLNHPSGLNTFSPSRLCLSPLLCLSQESGLGFPADLPACDSPAAHHLSCAAALAADGVPSRGWGLSGDEDAHGEDGREGLRPNLCCSISSNI